MDFILMKIHKGINFICGSNVSLGSYPFSFHQNNLGFYTHKQAQKDIIIGNNVFINSNCIVEYGLYEDTKIGNNCIIDGLVMIGHDVELGRSVQIGTGVKLLGHVKVGDYTKIFSNSVVNPKVKIGRNCIIGTLSYVRHDVPDNTVVYGSPAKIISYPIHYPRSDFA